LIEVAGEHYRERAPGQAAIASPVASDRRIA